jgi:hypothetical protein
MPAVNGVGEPCAGKPHARFEAAGAGNGADLTTVTGVAQPTGKPAEQRPQALPSASHRASPRPYAWSGRSLIVCIEEVPGPGVISVAEGPVRGEPKALSR